MPRLTIKQKSKGKLVLPHYLLINGKMLGLMKDPSITLEVPPATFKVRIQSVFKWFYSEAVVTTHNETDTVIEFTDREKWWDILFGIDLVLWCIKGLFHLAAPWTWIYEILTNGYFVAWLIYEWTIRKRYFKLNIYAKPAQKRIVIRDATPEDAPFLAKCIMAGMHFYDFETDIPENQDNPRNQDIYRNLVDCEKREDYLYTYKQTRVAEIDGVPVGSLLSYPGEIYKELRHKTFTELWPDLAEMDENSEQETGPGEYYLDSLAVVPAYRGRGVGRALMEDAIRKGRELGYSRIALIADSSMPHLISLYESIGFTPAEHRLIFGVDFQRMILD